MCASGFDAVPGRVSMCAAQFTLSMLVEMFLKPASLRKVRPCVVSDIADWAVSD